MKLLLQISGVDGIESDISYAIAEINDDVKQYLAQRQALFNTAVQFADDLLDLRFMGCDFVTFYHDLDVDAAIGEHGDLFDEQGFLEVPDSFANDEKSADVDLDLRLILDNDYWYVTAYENGIEVMTREVQFSKLCGIPIPKE